MLAGALCACQGSDGGDRENADARIVTTCTGETRAMPYSAGMSVTTKSGMKLYLDGAQPAPPSMGRNTWTLRVEDPSGAPVPDAVLTVDPQMPGPNGSHGSPMTAKVTPNGDGTYLLKPVDFSMDGYWEITIAVNSKSDTGMFPLCVE